MTRRFSIIGPVTGVLLAVITIVILLGIFDDRAAAVEPASETASGPSCRWGVSAHGVDQVAWLDDVGAGWYVFFGGFTDAAGKDVQIAPVISVKQDKNGAVYLDTYTINPALNALQPIIEAFPGTLWIVGNEVDRGPDPGELTTGQGDTFPTVYAEAYHEVYHFIKGIDPTALVANSAPVEVTPGRLQYLDLMWQAYQDQFGEPMPVDVWNMHVYVLPEAELDGTPNGIANVALGTDPSLAKRGPGANSAQCVLDEIYCFAEHDDVNLFEQQARAMRQWMFDHGQWQKPLILSEYSILYPCDDPQGVNCDYLRDEFGNDFDKQRVKNYLAATATKLEGMTDPIIGNPLDGRRLVQQWAWFSIHTTTQVGDVSDLVKVNSGGVLTELTEIGQAYLARATAAPKHVNLVPALVAGVTAETTSPGGSVDVSLSAIIVNNGSLAYSGAMTVTFYADSWLTQVIEQVPVQAPVGNGPLLRGCALTTVAVSATWPGLASGLHPFWVKVDGQGGASSSVVQSLVLVDPERMWLPVIGRHSEAARPSQTD
jgi:hypothetical protein